MQMIILLEKWNLGILNKYGFTQNISLYTKLSA